MNANDLGMYYMGHFCYMKGTLRPSLSKDLTVGCIFSRSISFCSSFSTRILSPVLFRSFRRTCGSFSSSVC